MKELWTALISLFKDVLGPFLAGYVISDSLDKQKQQKARVDALEERIAIENEIAASPSGSSRDKLLRDWKRM